MPCGPEAARFVLVEIGEQEEESHGMLTSAYSHIYHERVVGLLVKHELGVMTYADLKTVSRFTPTLMSVTGALLSGNARCGLTPDNHRDFYSSKYEIKFVDSVRTKLLDAIAMTKEWPVTQITQVHHLYISWHELVALYDHITKSDDYTSKYRANLALKVIRGAVTRGQQNKVSINTHLVYIAVAPLFAVRTLAWIWMACGDESQYMRMLKREGLYPKQLQTLFRDDLAQVYELQVLRNRAFSYVDWEKEVENRTTPKLAPLPAEVVFKHAASIFQQARDQGARQRRREWSDYWEMRWSHMPVGSVVSQYDEDRDLKKGIAA